MIQLTESWPSKSGLSRKEVPVSEFIPYACHYNDETILTKSGDLIQFLRIDGFSAENADFQDVDLRKELRNVLFKSIASPNFALWFHTIRQRQPGFPAGQFEAGFSRALNERWKTKNRGQHLFENVLYVSILRRGPGVRVPGLRRLLGSLSNKADATTRAAHLERACQELTDTRRRFEAALADYGPHVLRIVPVPIGRVSEPQAFLSRLVDLEDRTALVAKGDLSQRIATKRLLFGHNALECRGANRIKLGTVLSIKEYCAETAAGMLDKFFQLPYEYVITQTYIFNHRQEALAKIQRQQRLLTQSEDLAVSQVAQISQALDEATAGAVAFGDHHLTIMPIASSLARLNEAVAGIESELMDLGILAVREDLNLEPCFWAQLPGNMEHITRKATLSTANLAGFASLHNYPSGRIRGNHWGPAVTVLETQSGTPYFFNFHAGDVGHTSIIGPTGSGKTVLLAFLSAQARKFGGRLFFFDKDRGADIFIRALGGAYSVLGAGQASGMNPLQLPDSAQNRSFLSEWLQSLVTTLDEPLSSADASRIAEAVQGCYQLQPADRTLAKIAPFLGLAGPGSLGGRLAPWHSEGSFSHLFGDERDVLSLDNKMIGFEMGPILQERRVLGPVLLYLFHRIQSLLDGTPTMIVLDEAWALLDNPIFGPKIKDWLKTLRKLNAVVIFATQSVEDAAKSAISDTLVQQSATQIYFPNGRATDLYRTAFRLSERELDGIRSVDPSSRSFLLKHGRDTVWAKLDLNDLRDLIPVLSGRAETVLACERLRAQLGEAPAKWLPAFMEETHATRNQGK